MPPEWRARLVSSASLGQGFVVHMFVLLVIKDHVRIAPSVFRKDLNMAITEELNRKFANKVLHQRGLCISVYDLEDVGVGFLHPGDGGAHYTGSRSSNTFL